MFIDLKNKDKVIIIKNVKRNIVLVKSICSSKKYLADLSYLKEIK